MPKPVLVTAYVNPDLDGTAGAIAYAEFLNATGREAVAGVFGVPHDEAKYVLDRFHIPYPRTINSCEGFDEVILVDASELAGLEGKIPPERVVEIIDHRKIHEGDKFPNAKLQIELVGAAVTLVGEKFMAGDTPISKASAILLEAGIISNTLNFKSGTTTERDRRASTWLNKISGLPPEFANDMFRMKSDLSGEKLEERTRGDFALFSIGGKAVGIAQLEMLGGEKLIAERKEEILAILHNLKREHDLDHIFLTLIELEADCNLILADDPDTQALLGKALGVSFVGSLAKRDGLIMRKQVVPLLKEILEAGL